MRLRDIIKNGFKQIVTHEGPNRAERRRENAAAIAPGLSKAKPRNWRRKLRKFQKARRKQKFGGKAP